MNKIEHHIKDLEDKLLHSDFQKYPEILNDLLSDDFEEIGSIGKKSNREEVINWLLAKDTDIRWSLTEFRVRELAPNLVLAIYRAAIKDNQTARSNGSVRSSIWKLMDGNWKMVFHQGTKIVAD